jgi:type VI secretion system protein ImpM
VPDGRDPCSLGLFGKLPAIGDFVGRGLGHARRQALDIWLAQGLLELQARSPQWLDAYLVTPVWQWVMPAGRLCDEATAGVLMPSVDRVGRYFPLIALRSYQPGEDHARLGVELAALARALPAALHEGLEPDVLVARLTDAARAPGAESFPAPAYEQMLARFAHDGALSLWWSLPGPTAPPRFISHRGSADPGLFVSLFDGR